jgi:hypothetical protein
MGLLRSVFDIFPILVILAIVTRTSNLLIAMRGNFSLFLGPPCERSRVESENSWGHLYEGFGVGTNHNKNG